MNPEERKAKIARFRKLVKAECQSLHVRYGGDDHGTAHGWVMICTKDYTCFTEDEQAAMTRLGLWVRGGNCYRIHPEDLEGVLQRLESRQADPPDAVPIDDMVLVANSGAAISIAQRNVVEKLTEPRPKGWRALKHGSAFAIVDERDDLIADVYSNQEDALTIAASRKLLVACKAAIELATIQTNRPGKHGTLAYKVSEICRKAIEETQGGDR